jgi:diaminopropionate ammonia-lyase
MIGATLYDGKYRDDRAIRAVPNNSLRLKFDPAKVPSGYSREIAEIARAFHSSFPQYKPTELFSLKTLAGQLGVSRVIVKDESTRFGLKAFKILGGLFAIGKFLAQKLGLEIDRVNFEYLKSNEVIARTGQLTFTTASDGNHGRGVAWAATRLGHKAVIYLPKGTVKSRVNAITETGAGAVVTGVNYDKTVMLAKETAQKNNWILIQDTAFEGYTEIPFWIMQGYTTMALEAIEQMREAALGLPTHIFLQAGVGSMAASILAYFVNEFRESYPVAAIVEPENAACFFDSTMAGDGRPHPARGNLQTMMAGLSCGVPSTAAWDIIHDFADMMIACPDYVAVEGMKIYAAPREGDDRIISGESGAVTMGVLQRIMKDMHLIGIRKKLGLNRDSIVFLINTEGDTDPGTYRRIVEHKI